MVVDARPQPFTASQRQLAIGLVAVVTILAMENLSVATILPAVEADLGDIALYGWVGAAFTLAQLVGVVVGGRWCDRANPALPLVAGVGSFMVGLTAAAFAPSMHVLVAARACQGLGAGMAPSTAYVCIGRAIDENRRPRMFALLSTAWIAPSLGGPALASVVAEHVGWRWVFAGLLPFTLAGAAVALGPVRAIGRPPVTDVGRGVDTSTVRSAVLVGVGATISLAGLDAGSRWLTPAMLVAGLAIAVPAFRHLTPPGTLRARPGIAAACAVKGLLTFSFFGADFYVALSLVDGRGRSTLYAGAVLMVGSFCWTAASWVQTRLVRSWGYRRLVRAGLAGVAIGVGVLVVLVVWHTPTWVAFLGEGIAGFGIGLSYPALSQVVLLDADPEAVGVATSAMQLCDVLGVSLGIGFGGAVVAAGDRAQWSTARAVGVAWSISLAVALLSQVPARGVRSRAA